MKLRFVFAAAMTTLVAAPIAAPAQDAPSAKNMKGPPNANGYGKEKMGDTATTKMEPSAKDMKGPPNANGYQKQ